jgi:hypothetical protein
MEFRTMPALDKPDLIAYAVHVMPATEPDKGPGKRLELGFKNLTDGEASELLITLDRLQRARAAAVALADASKREH